MHRKNHFTSGWRAIGTVFALVAVYLLALELTANPTKSNVDYENAYQQGIKAQASGGSVTENPHTQRTPANQGWAHGYMDRLQQAKQEEASDSPDHPKW